MAIFFKFLDYGDKYWWKKLGGHWWFLNPDWRLGGKGHPWHEDSSWVTQIKILWKFGSEIISYDRNIWVGTRCPHSYYTAAVTPQPLLEQQWSHCCHPPVPLLEGFSSFFNEYQLQGTNVSYGSLQDSHLCNFINLSRPLRPGQSRNWFWLLKK